MKVGFRVCSFQGKSGDFGFIARQINTWLADQPRLKIINIETVYNVAGAIRLAGSVDTKAQEVRVWYTESSQAL